MGLVVDTRDPRERRGFDEAVVVESAGMEYVNIALRGWPADEGAFEEMGELLRAGARRPMLVHCGSGNRVGALMLAYLILDEGMPSREAVELAVEIGLRSQPPLDQALAYVARVEGSEEA